MAEKNCDRKKYIVFMTEEQKEITSGVFNFHGWDLEIYCEEEYNSSLNVADGTTRSASCSDVENSSSQKSQSSEDSVPEQGPSNEFVKNKYTAPSTENDTEMDRQNENIETADDTDLCPHCLCSPCITSMVPPWLGDGRPPRPGNNLIRKKMYRKFWTLLDRRGVWSNPAYLRRKQHQMEEAHVELTVREIMPLCVLELVRNLYPNPKDIQYMGHYW